jgi:hypothetical protein
MNTFFNLKFTLNGISDTFTLQGSIQLTEELLNGEEQTVEFQGADESGKIIFGGAGIAAAAALATGAAAGAGKKCSVM